MHCQLPDEITTEMVAYSKTRASENYVLTNNYVHETNLNAADFCLMKRELSKSDYDV